MSLSDTIRETAEQAREMGYLAPRRAIMSRAHMGVRRSEYDEDLEALDDPKNANPDILNRAQRKQLYYLSRKIERLHAWANELRTKTGQAPLNPPPMDIPDHMLAAAEKRFSLLELDK